VLYRRGLSCRLPDCIESVNVDRLSIEVGRRMEGWRKERKKTEKKREKRRIKEVDGESATCFVFLFFQLNGHVQF
jgi:hypothetical protein